MTNVTEVLPILLGPYDLLACRNLSGQGLLHEALERGKGLGRLAPVIAYPLAAPGKHMLSRVCQAACAWSSA